MNLKKIDLIKAFCNLSYFILRRLGNVIFDKITAQTENDGVVLMNGMVVNASIINSVNHPYK